MDQQEKIEEMVKQLREAADKLEGVKGATPEDADKAAGELLSCCGTCTGISFIPPCAGTCIAVSPLF